MTGELSKDRLRPYLRRAYEAGLAAGVRLRTFADAPGPVPATDPPAPDEYDEHTGGWKPDDVGRYADYFSADENGHYPGALHSYFALSVKDFADRSHLVRKQIDRKDGRKMWVWVNPNKDKEAAERKARSDAFKQKNEGRTPKEHLQHLKAQAEPKRQAAREALAKALAAPNTIGAKEIPALTAHLDALTRDELREHARKVKAKIGGVKRELVDRLLKSVGVPTDEERRATLEERIKDLGLTEGEANDMRKAAGLDEAKSDDHEATAKVEVPTVRQGNDGLRDTETPAPQVPVVQGGKDGPKVVTPRTKDEYIAQEVERLRSEYPDNDEESLRLQAESNADENWKPKIPGKYAVDDTVSAGGITGSYRGTHFTPDGKKMAVIANGSGNNLVPFDQVAHAPAATPADVGSFDTDALNPAGTAPVGSRAGEPVDEAKRRADEALPVQPEPAPKTPAEIAADITAKRTAKQGRWKQGADDAAPTDAEVDAASKGATAPSASEPVPADAPTPHEDEPGFTGIDALGREWRDGKLVARPDDEPEDADNAPATEPAAPAESEGSGTGGAGSGQPVDGGSGGGEPPGNAGENGAGAVRPRIVTARPELTKTADPGLVPESVRPHLNETQQQGAALAIDAMQKHGGFLLADGTGAGKTRQQLAVAQHFLQQGKKVVIVSPAEVIKPDWKKGTMTGSFAADSAAMGVPVKLAKGDADLAAGAAHVTTYNELGKLKDKIDKDTVILFDESHSMKNAQSARAKHGKEAMEKAAAVMYSTATPGDKPLHIAHLFRANVFGNEGKTKTLEKLGMELHEQHVGGGQYQKVWRVNPKVGYTECVRRLSGLFDQLTRDGLMVKRELSMNGVNVGMDHVPLDQKQHEELERVYNEALGKHDGNKAVALMAARLHQEPMKIPATADIVKQELAQGRSPVVFVGRVNDIGGGEDAEDGEESPPESVGTAGALKAALVAAGVPESDIGELHGGATTTPAQKKKAMDNFQANKTKVIIATIQSGGTGINLDDTTGTRPRTMVMMTPPFTANDMAQAMGRVHRLNTKTPAKIRGVLSDTEIDRWNAELLQKKFKALGATAGGESGKGTTAVGGTEDTSGAKPYDWGRSLIPTPKVRVPTPFAHKDVAAKYGGRPVKVGDGWVTEFPSQADHDAYKAAVAPKPSPAPSPASGGSAAPSSSAAPKYKRVSTSNGERSVHTMTPNSAYWNKVHKNRPDYVSVRKNPRSGDWELSVWGKNDAEVEKNVADLRRRMG